MGKGIFCTKNLKSETAIFSAIRFFMANNIGVLLDKF
jgi:hypothetical protein